MKNKQSTTKDIKKINIYLILYESHNQIQTLHHKNGTPTTTGGSTLEQEGTSVTPKQSSVSGLVVGGSLAHLRGTGSNIFSTSIFSFK